MFLYKAATVEGAVLGRSKKKKNKQNEKANSTVLVQKTIPLIFSYSSIKENPIALNTKKCYFDRAPVRHIAAESQKATQRQKGIAYTKK